MTSTQVSKGPPVEPSARYQVVAPSGGIGGYLMPRISRISNPSLRVPLFPVPFSTTTSHFPGMALSMLNEQVISLEELTATFSPLISSRPILLREGVAPSSNLSPLMVTSTFPSLVALSGDMEVTEGETTYCFMIRAPSNVPVWPSGFVTLTSHIPWLAFVKSAQQSIFSSPS